MSFRVFLSDPFSRVAVMHRDTNVVTPPPLACTSKDRMLKFSKYEECGVRSHWIVDPAGPSITAWDLVDARFIEVARATGEEVARVTRPFSLEFSPAALI